jgi:hypothetical protein
MGKSPRDRGDGLEITLLWSWSSRRSSRSTRSQSSTSHSSWQPRSQYSSRVTASGRPVD